MIAMQGHDAGFQTWVAAVILDVAVRPTPGNSWAAEHVGRMGSEWLITGYTCDLSLIND